MNVDDHFGRIQSAYRLIAYTRTVTFTSISKMSLLCILVLYYFRPNVLNYRGYTHNKHLTTLSLLVVCVRLWCKRAAIFEMRDLLRSRSQNEAEDRDKADEEEDKRNDWRLAAAVVDRILCIIFIILFVGGTVVFFVIFGTVHRAIE